MQEGIKTSFAGKDQVDWDGKEYEVEGNGGLIEGIDYDKSKSSMKCLSRYNKHVSTPQNVHRM